MSVQNFVNTTNDDDKIDESSTTANFSRIKSQLENFFKVNNDVKKLAVDDCDINKKSILSEQNQNIKLIRTNSEENNQHSVKNSNSVTNKFYVNLNNNNSKNIKTNHLDILKLQKKKADDDSSNLKKKFVVQKQHSSFNADDFLLLNKKDFDSKSVSDNDNVDDLKNEEFSQSSSLLTTTSHKSNNNSIDNGDQGDGENASEDTDYSKDKISTIHSRPLNPPPLPPLSLNIEKTLKSLITSNLNNDSEIKWKYIPTPIEFIINNAQKKNKIFSKHRSSEKKTGQISDSSNDSENKSDLNDNAAPNFKSLLKRRKSTENVTKTNNKIHRSSFSDPGLQINSSLKNEINLNTNQAYSYSTSLKQQSKIKNTYLIYYEDKKKNDQIINNLSSNSSLNSDTIYINIEDKNKQINKLITTENIEKNIKSTDQKNIQILKRVPELEDQNKIFLMRCLAAIQTPNLNNNEKLAVLLNGGIISLPIHNLSDFNFQNTDENDFPNFSLTANHFTNNRSLRKEVEIPINFEDEASNQEEVIPIYQTNDSINYITPILKTSSNILDNKKINKNFKENFIQYKNVQEKENQAVIDYFAHTTNYKFMPTAVSDSELHKINSSRLLNQNKYIRPNELINSTNITAFKPKKLIQLQNFKYQRSLPNFHLFNNENLCKHQNHLYNSNNFNTTSSLSASTLCIKNDSATQLSNSLKPLMHNQYNKTINFDFNEKRKIPKINVNLIPFEITARKNWHKNNSINISNTLGKTIPLPVHLATPIYCITKIPIHNVEQKISKTFYRFYDKNKCLINQSYKLHKVNKIVKL